MDPVSIGVGVAAGYVIKNMTGGSAPKKKTASKSASKTKSNSSAKKSKTHPGINQRTGRLKKGYKYGKNGRILKAKATCR